MGIELALGTLVAGSLYSGERARSEQRKAGRARNAIRQRQEQRARLQDVRQRQIAEARLTAAGAQTGTLESSGFRGARSSIGATTGANLGFRNQIGNLQQQIADRIEGANRMSGYSQILGTGATLLASAGLGGGANSAEGANQATTSSYAPGGGGLG